MPPNTQEVISAFLATMADTDEVSWFFYCLAILHLTLFATFFLEQVRQSFLYKVILLISLAFFPILLCIGAYFATLPPA